MSTPDPITAEFDRVWSVIRLVVVGVVVLLMLLAGGVAASLAIRSNDIERQANKNSREAVESCFRQAAQRPELRDISEDPSLSLAVRSYIRGLYENTPTQAECYTLAESLNVTPPRLPPPETIR